MKKWMVVPVACALFLGACGTEDERAEVTEKSSSAAEEEETVEEKDPADVGEFSTNVSSDDGGEDAAAAEEEEKKEEEEAEKLKEQEEKEKAEAEEAAAQEERTYPDMSFGEKQDEVLIFLNEELPVVASDIDAMAEWFDTNVAEQLLTPLTGRQLEDKRAEYDDAFAGAMELEPRVEELEPLVEIFQTSVEMQDSFYEMYSEAAIDQNEAVLMEADELAAEVIQVNMALNEEVLRLAEEFELTME